ncbi:uncharacterized protein [Malus domestica]|uniref:uncharacterized protein n=1 Tax=Malus domestica TaxID=3750 RepID=UPI003975FB3E
MDKSWATLNPFTEDYRTGLAKFISNSFQVSSHDDNIKCPCAKYLNRLWLSNNEVEAHLTVEGMDRSYLEGSWVLHGETFGDPLPNSQDAQQIAVVNIPHCELGPSLEDIFSGPSVMGGRPISNHSGQEALIRTYTRKFEVMVQDANTELYPGCSMKKMDFLIRVFQNKCLYGCSESAVQANLQLLKHILPNGHSLPKKVKSTKGLLKNFMLPHQKIHACENDCMLYWKHNSGLNVCHTCGVSKYTTEVDDTAQNSKKRIPRKVLTYFPITPRLQRLYMSRHTSEDMCRLGLSRPEDGFLRHPADSFAWKQLDMKFPTFGGKIRNVRLGLASDGFNPFGKCSTDYNTWAILLTIYNLPPWWCMKSPFILMALLIPGKESPGNDNDIYLEPLIDELKVLWTSGVPTYDTFRQETFTLRAVILWTISDFPGYGNLSGWSIHGKLACLPCNYKTELTYLKNSRNIVIWFTVVSCPCHMFFIDKGKPLTSLMTESKHLPHDRMGMPSAVIHLTVQIWKSKDNLNARLDLELMGMKPELQRKFVNGKPKMHPGAYTMKPLENELFCKVLASTKVPDNYSSNISRLVHVKEKIVNQLQQLGDPRATDDLVALANGPSKWCQRYKIFGTLDWTYAITIELEPKIRCVYEMKLNDRWKKYKANLEKKQVNESKSDCITFFTLTYTQKNGEPVDARSAAIIDDFNTKLKLYEDRNEIITDEVRHIMYADVLGPERNNCVKGFGTGVMWSDN